MIDMKWLEIWAMLKVIGIVVSSFIFICLLLAFALVGIKDLIDKRKEKQGK